MNKFDAAGLQADRWAMFTCAAIVTVLSLGIFLLKASSLPLTDPDESRCAEIVDNMLIGGNWVIPYKNGEIYFDKPAPFFWLAAAVQYVSGSMELGGRFVAAVAGAGTVLITFLLARRISNNLTALFAGLFLATGPEFFFVARWYRMDMPFVLFMWAALWWFWRYEAQAHRASVAAARSKNAQWTGFYLFCALATLMKGPAGAVLPVMVVGAYFAVSRNWRRMFELLNVPGILAYLAIAAPWYIIASLRVPNYAYQFFIEQNLGRYASGGSYGQHFPGIAYVAIVLGGMLPWTVFLPAAVEKRFPWRWSERMKRPDILFLWTAALVPLIFFAFCKTKMANYVVPVFPPLAILIAIPLAAWATSDARDKAYRDAAAVLCAVIVLAGAALVGAQWYFKLLNIQGIAGAGLLLACAVMTAQSFIRRRRVNAINWACASMTVLLLSLILQIHPAAYEMMSNRQLGVLVRETIKKGDAVCLVSADRESFSLYSGCEKHYLIKTHDPNDRKTLGDLLASGSDVYMLVSSEKNMEFLKGFSNRPLETIAEKDKRFFEIFGHKFPISRKFYVVTTAQLAGPASKKK
jgi:4-amino-4-deoxy-L-arabinose transferase-like glycosyltransferase